MYRQFARLYPGRSRFEKLIDYSGIEIDIKRFIGFIIVFGFLFSVLAGVYSVLLFKVNFFLVAVPVLIVFHLVVYSWFLLSADAKARFVESILPDALQLMASNLRAGMTIDRALLLSARKEFGPLKTEIERMGKEITLGKDMSESLLALAGRINSEKLDKTMKLIASGISSGGELASLLEHTADYLRSQELVEKKIRASVNLYVIFITIAISAGAPMLFALSSYMVKVLGKTMSQVTMPSSISAPITLGQIVITADFVILYSIISLTTTAILGAMMIGMIKKGQEKAGLKMVPVLVLISLGVFFIVRMLITKLMSGMFGF